MDYSLFLTNLGSLCLGMTLAIMLLFTATGRHGDTNGIEGCFMTIICVSGFCIALLFYIWAVKV